MFLAGYDADTVRLRRRLDTVCPPPSHIEQTLNVTVTATFNPIIHAGNFPGTFTYHWSGTTEAIELKGLSMASKINAGILSAG